MCSSGRFLVDMVIKMTVCSQTTPEEYVDHLLHIYESLTHLSPTHDHLISRITLKWVPKAYFENNHETNRSFYIKQ